jgi:hypothetical protein
MKHLKSINEYNRTVGFRYSKPTESYTVDLLCLGGDNVTKDNINLGLSEVSNLVFDPEMTLVDNMDQREVEMDGNLVIIDSVVNFNVTTYNSKEIYGIVKELNKNLSNLGITIVHHFVEEE